MRIRLPNGLIVEGAEQQIARHLQNIGIDGEGLFYTSSSKGKILISGMESTHLRNAILKIYKQWLNGLYGVKDPIEFCEKFIEGCPDRTFIAMVEELSKRES